MQVTRLVAIAIAAFFLQVVDAKVMSRCELVKEVRKYTATNPNFSNTLLPQCECLFFLYCDSHSWFDGPIIISLLTTGICLIEQESGRNTTKRTPYPPPPNESYGLFQVFIKSKIYLFSKKYYHNLCVIDSKLDQ